ncbi:hypothetical protein [Virgisporangium aurantiacum]|uniref:Uncharacterized protein n=1 Tax=Virgisporangium aurantiacum TaxID=175570 RepID=A0A8J4DZP4_9ACTN|nr:hypothetical protein [Virgisporangium aurantiacum]GIJ54237.1 hypothetical protein Vau01_017530 [Virgisporangium aurantiacum]
MNNPEPAADQPTVRLIQILRTYCTGLRPDGLADLTATVKEGRYPWLRAELAAAIRSADTAAWWDDAIGRPAEPFNPRTDDERRAEQSQLWRALFGTP